jgi:protein regulator of cytokinesis 1
VEVERLDKLKANKTKELVIKKKEELDEICRQAHMQPDKSASEENLMAIIDSGAYCIY